MFWKKKTILLVLVLAFVGSGAKADYTFGEPVNLSATINTPHDDGTPVISPDGLEMYILSSRPGGYGAFDIWVAKRANVEDEWGPPENAGPEVNSSCVESSGSISADGLSFYFTSNYPSRYGAYDIYTTTRSTKEVPWEPIVNLGQIVNSPNSEEMPVVSPDALELFFGSNRKGGFGMFDIWVSTRASASDPWGTPVNLGSTINSSAHDRMGCISPDGLRLFFSSQRSGGFGDYDAWMVTRPSNDAAWGTPVNLGAFFNTSYAERVCGISPDGQSLYFDDYSVERPGNIGFADIWQVSVKPIVDLNSDGIVDCLDMCIMVDYWGTDESLFDIGPTPFGDGVVDVQDLIVLSEHLFEEVEEVKDPTLVAHWPLDEVEGDTAHDSVAGNDGFGSPDLLWRPENGKVGGALELDGIDDSIVTTFSLNPVQTTFSSFAWIKGGGPEQVVLSQNDGVDWLLADADGHFMTALRRGSSGSKLTSAYVITDGDWHHIGIVWDGSHRHLYAGGVEVAKDTSNIGYVSPSNGNLCIGCGNAFDAGSFFSGLIDDVRIYNVALSADKIATLAQ